PPNHEVFLLKRPGLVKNREMVACFDSRVNREVHPKAASGATSAKIGFVPGGKLQIARNSSRQEKEK
ncbi:MAG TPA: hypothetical protein VFR10_14295, partial [bacterium]|nr:hypothetical protein [bacterium]